MTALAGLWLQEAREDPRRACARMLNAQSIYGPHGEAIRSDGSVAVGRRLFRTLPEDAYDRGPVVGGGGRFLVAADLRLDNRDELAADLQLEPAELRTLPDAALLMRGYERWEEECVDRLVGDFAFALWDSSRRRMILARDFLGQRPLHYHQGKGFFAFASMPKGLHAHPEVPYRVDGSAVADFLALMPETRSTTFFEAIEKVEPGHILSVSEGSRVSRRFWQPSLVPIRFKRSEEYEDALREKLDEAVAARLRGAQDKVGTHLSAGLDSGAVTATAARLLSPSGGRVFAFTSVPAPGFEESGPAHSIADEGPLAAMTAARYPNIYHVLVRAGPRSPLDSLERHFFLAERPVLNLVNFPWWDAIHDSAKERGLRVLLTGIIGNMSFSYSGMEHLSELLATGRLVRLTSQSIALRRNGTRWGTIGAQALGPFLPRTLWNAIGRARGKGWDLGQYTALRPEALDGMGVRQRARESGLDFSYRPIANGAEMRLWVLRRADPGNYNKAALGGWGIDSRDPTGDRRLVEFCLRVPTEQYLARGTPRGLARRALRDRLPQEVLQEKRKGYQAADWAEGFRAHRDQLREEIERIGSGYASELLDIERMRRLIDEVPAGAANDSRSAEAYRLALLRGLSAGHFIRKAAGSNS